MRGLSPAAAEALLAAIVVTGAALIWLWLSTSTAPPASTGKAVGAALQVKAAGGWEPGGYCVYVTLLVHNVGDTVLHLDANSSVYIETPGAGYTRAWQAPAYNVTLPPGGSILIRAVPGDQGPPPLAARVAAREGVAATASLRGRCRGQATAGRTFLVPAVDGYTATYTLPLGVNLTVKVEAVDQYNYNVTYWISWPEGVVADYGYAEIITVDNRHPLYAANPIAEHRGPVAGPNYWSNYWTPILDYPDYSEFPATVILAVAYHQG